MHRHNGTLWKREDSIENVIMGVGYEFRMLQLERDNAMGMLRVYAGEKSNLETTIQHLTNDIVLRQNATEQK
ncbi:unnamed protein product [Penicillium pancosmium]